MVADKIDLVTKAAIAHLWFATIHPFEDGNGRITRALSDVLLARADKSNQRFYSMSAQIRKERKGYYEILEKKQKGNLDITEWIVWFLQCLINALRSNETCEILHISLSTLDTYVKKGAITCSHVGKRVLFSQDDIDRALAKNRIN